MFLLKLCNLRIFQKKRIYEKCVKNIDFERVRKMLSKVKIYARFVKICINIDLLSKKV